MMKSIFYILLIIPFICFCSSSDKQKNDKTGLLVQQLDTFYKAGEWKKAIAIIDSLKEEKVGGNFLLIEAECYAGLGKYEKSISILHHELKTDTKNVHYVYQTLGNVYYVKGDNEKAIIAYNKVIELRPSYARPYIKLAKIYSLQKDNDKAIKHYLSAIYLFYEHDFFDEIIEFSNKVLLLDSLNTDAYAYLQYAHNATQEYDKALPIGLKLDTLFEQRKLWKERHNNWLYTGISAYHVGDYQLSYTLLHHSIQFENIIKNYGIVVFSYLTAICVKLDKMEEAPKYAIKAKEINESEASSFINKLIGEK